VVRARSARGLPRAHHGRRRCSWSSRRRHS
jgi:hypothetical protein